MAPFSWNGANFLYERFIKSFVLKHEADVDKYLKKGKTAVEDFAKKGKQYSIEFLISYNSNAEMGTFKSVKRMLQKKARRTLC